MRQATPADLPILTQLMQRSFSLDDAGEAEQIARGDLARPNACAFLALIDGTPVGRLSALIEGDEVYLRAFGVLADYRGRRIGRALLTGTIARLYAAGHRRFALDVVTDNRAALGIYRSCGFREATVYEYYPWPLR